MQFTPQQMMGFAGYSSRTLLGNWSEEQQLQQEKSKSFVQQFQSGTSLSQQIQKKIVHHTTSIDLTPQHFDGFVHFGDRIALQCAEHGYFLSVDLDDGIKVAGHPKKFIPTCAIARKPVLRNVWTITRVPGPDDDLFPPEEVDVLHYNQPFKLQLTDELCDGQVLSLYSEPISGTSYAKASRHQEVSVVDQATVGMVWKAVCTSLEYRIEMEGAPVQSNVAVILNHSKTNTPLWSQKGHVHLNDFGPECEVACYLDRSTGAKKRNVQEHPTNYWAFISGLGVHTPMQSPGVDDHQKLLQDQARKVIDKIRCRLVQRGGNSFRGLSRVLTILDDKARSHLDKYELENGLETLGINLQPSELGLVIGAFSCDGGNSIPLRDFLDNIRGPMSERRQRIVQQAFALVDLQGNGAVQFEELRCLYDAKKHPDVLARLKTPEQVLQDFISAWDKDSDAVVTYDDFLEYYADIGAAIDTDEFFELMVRNTWHLSGGSGVATNTSCRRVVVTHQDGTQTIEEIKNDLRISCNDMVALRQNLEAQGIRDVRKIQLYS